MDDEEEFARRWAKDLQAGANAADVKVEATPVYGPELGSFVSQLYERSRGFRDSASPPEALRNLDECSLLIIDSDLRETREVGLVSGVDIAYAARCFSEVACIVVLNAYGDDPFDLTLLGHRRSFADLHLGSAQLGNPGLWSLDHSDAFRPWSWPLLHREAARVRERRNWLLQENRLNEPIIRLFGFDDSEVAAMPPSMASFITAFRNRDGASDGSLGNVSTVEFLLGSEFGLQRRDAEVLKKDPQSQREVFARVGGARLAKWLNCVVAPGQEILVDAPHLVSRYPSVLSKGELDDLDRTARLDFGNDPSKTLRELGLDDPHGPLREFLFDLGLWADRPLWWGQRLDRSNLQEAEKPWEFTAPGFAFCEDASRFAPESEVQRFACDLETPYRIRYLTKDDHGVAYRPRENLVNV